MRSTTNGSVRRSTIAGSGETGPAVGNPPRPEYPRPQFRRPGWTNLNGEWALAFDDEDAGLSLGWHSISPENLGSERSPLNSRITVPFCYQSKLSGIEDTSFHDVVWHARTFDSRPTLGDERLLLHCGAVDYRATVWVNGTQVATHEGGHNPFSADVTPALGDRRKPSRDGSSSRPDRRPGRGTLGLASSGRTIRGLDRPGRMTLDRSVDNQNGQNKASVQSVCSRRAPEMEKERETKEDGRYIIFYSFGIEKTQEGEDD